MRKLSGPDEVEYKRLLESVMQIDGLTAASAAAGGAIANALAAFAAHARLQMGTLEEKGS